MKYIILILSFLLSLSAVAGGNSQLVQFKSLTETGLNEYTLTYQKSKSKETVTLHLEYNSLQYAKLDFLSLKQYKKSIDLLKKQIDKKAPARFGSFGSGPCVIDKKNNIYRSDALDIYDEKNGNDKLLVVYAFCEYQ
jgi:hypothetical protein